ncbi:MAG: hypothetical protein JXR27_11720 [Paludibacteraceae bacterium]|nr:hypothetical protein [Paludibacteraceae bacterium]
MKKLTSATSVRFVVILTLLSVVAGTLTSQENEVFNSRYKMWENMIEKNHVYISAYVGHGSYSMNGLKKVHEQFLSLYGIAAIPNSNFPPYPLYGISIARKYDNARFGFDFEYMSTGARSSLADYSAQFTSDFICKGYKFGIFLEKEIGYRFPKAEKLEFGYVIEAGAITTKMDYEANLNYSPPEINDEKLMIEAEGTSLFAEPALLARWPLTRTSFLQLNAGFFFDFPVEFYMTYHVPQTSISWFGYRVKLKFTQRL